MYRCQIASTRDFLLFLHTYCTTKEGRLSIKHHFKVEVDAYEEYPPWHWAYNADCSARHLKDAVIALKVSDLQRRIVYYPVFSEADGKEMLKAWKMQLPPKMNAFLGDESKSVKMHPENLCFCNLIIYARMFMILQQHLHTPMPFAFNNFFQQLHEFPKSGVAAEPIRLINEVIGEFIRNNHDGFYVNCLNLQEFIAYIEQRYSILPFKSTDFSLLRKKLLAAYPDDSIYF